MIMRWPYLKVLMFSGVYFVPKRRPKILTTFWTCVATRRGAPGAVGRLSRPRRRRRGDRVTQACRIEWRATSSPRAGVEAAHYPSYAVDAARAARRRRMRTQVQKDAGKNLLVLHDRRVRRLAHVQRFALQREDPIQVAANHAKTGNS